ncbi:MAG: hypothetical protein AB9873_09960 [Syntrophobacteraceae bacterium]
MKPLVLVLTVLVFNVFGVPPATGETVQECMEEPKAEFAECKADCREAFQLAKDACLNKDHACLEACRVERDGCVSEPLAALEVALTGCNERLSENKATCRARYSTPDQAADLDQCIDQAQVLAFQCRDEAREATAATLRQCRVSFKACARVCPPVAQKAANPVRACVDLAKSASLLCTGGCSEERQVAGDACREKDHACMEECRSARTLCLSPITMRLEVAILTCNADRDAAIENCKLITDPNTRERDACTDAAQVDAFQCRDAEREKARTGVGVYAPGMQSCRDQFPVCVQSCPAR